MDWTSVYAESGDEELLPPQPKIAPRISRLVSAVYVHHHANGNTMESPQRHFLGVVFNRHEVLPYSVDVSENEDHTDHGELGSDNWKLDTSRSSNYTLGALYCLSINYIFGVGCLGVPFAFARAGILLGASLVVLVSILSYMTVMWVAESMIRSGWLNSFSTKNCDNSTGETKGMTQSTSLSPRREFSMTKIESRGEGGFGTVAVESEDSRKAASEKTSLLNPPKESRSQKIVAALSEDYSDNDDGDNRRVTEIECYNNEVIDLVYQFLGPIHRNIYQASLLWLMYVGLLAYTQVFVGALNAILFHHDNGHERASNSHENQNNPVSLMVFSAIVIPLSCSELEEQVGIQAFMAAVRFLAILIMVIGSLAALMVDGDTNNNEVVHARSPPYFAERDEDGCHMSYTACFGGFGVAFSTALFSQLFQHSVPGLLRPLAEQPERKRRRIPLVFGASLLTTCLFYIILGSSAASYFGANTNPSVNLNFAHFLYGMDPERTNTLAIYVASITSGIVVLFPALDTLSVFPLIANTLGNNLLASCSPYIVKQIEKKVLPLWKNVFEKSVSSCGEIVRALCVMTGTEPHQQSQSQSRQQSQQSRRETKRRNMEQATKFATVLFRLIASIPPLLGSIWAKDLSFSLQLAGVAGLYVAFFAPALLQRSSCRAIIEEYGKDKGTATIYSGWYSSTVLTIPVLLFATFALVVVLIQIRDEVNAMK